MGGLKQHQRRCAFAQVQRVSYRRSAARKKTDFSFSHAGPSLWTSEADSLRLKVMSDTQNKTVLIVDDDEEIRQVLRLLCESEDLDVVGEAANGVEAVPLALNNQPDFVILDYKLPRLDGEGAAEILRAVTPGSKIVAFSAILESRPEWADAYLNKDRIVELMPLLVSLFH
jgi:CheY-like chemotaxis protein